MEKEKEKKMQKVSKLTPEKKKSSMYCNILARRFQFFFLVWDKKRVD